MRDTLASADAVPAPVDPALGWLADWHLGLTRLSLFGTDEGKRAAFVRLPERKVAVIILSESDALDARAVAEAILSRLVATRR